MADNNALKAQINADPRVQAAAAAAGGYLSPAELRKFYPQAPSEWGYKGPGDGSRGWRSGPAGVVDNFDKWDVILPIGAAAIGGIGGALNAAAGAPAAAQAATSGATLPSSTIPGLHNAVPNTTGMASQGVSQGISLGGMLPGGNGGGAANGGGALDALKGFFTNPADLAGLAGVIAGLAGGAGGGGGESEEAKRMNQITEARMRRVDPLQQAVTQLAWGRLPTSARTGIAPPAYAPLPEYR